MRALPCLALAILFVTLTAVADVYTWVDDQGMRHYSDKKPVQSGYESVRAEPQNLVEIPQTEQNAEDASNKSLHTVDNFRMPRRQSDVQHRFSLTSGLNGGEPRDRLQRINIGMKQKQIHVYVKLIGVERNQPYTLRYRILDAKNELIFDKDHTQTSSTNSLWFSAKVTPAVAIDAPGSWTFQGILDDRYLFEERRTVSF
ncbi:MAG: DUF4124 domain-containing protein [Pseudomonadota bacterium]